MGKWGLGMLGHHRQPAEARLRPILRLQLPGPRPQPLPDVHLPQRQAHRPRRTTTARPASSTRRTCSRRRRSAFIEKNKAKPFFLYLPFTVPHVAVQVPEDSLAEYKGKLGDDPAYDGKKGYLPHPAPHAAYAAMVTRMDRSVGRIVDKLKELKLDKDTLVHLHQRQRPDAQRRRGGLDVLRLGRASCAASRGACTRAASACRSSPAGRARSSRHDTATSAFYFPDVLPTLCEIRRREAARRRSTASASCRRCSENGKQKTHEFLYWEFPALRRPAGGDRGQLEGRAAEPGQGRSSKTELYDLRRTRAKRRTWRRQNPDVVARLEKLMKEQHTPNRDFPLPSIDVLVKKRK